MKTIVMVLTSMTMIFLVSCGTTTVTLHSSGETASVYLERGEIVTGELIALTDSTLFIQSTNMHEISLAQISSIKVKLENTHEWMANVLIFEGAPSLLAVLVGNVWASGNGGNDVGAFRIAGVAGLALTTI